VFGATAATLIAAIAVTGVVYEAAAAAGLVDRGVLLPSPLGYGPLSLASVAVTALIATLGAGAIFAILAGTTQRPVRFFRVASTVLVLASLSMPATIPGPSIGMRLALATMHVVVWAAAVTILPALARAPKGGGAS
jgi:hypothetical protein